MAQGWGKPGLCKKYHYYEEGKTLSVCGKWWWPILKKPEHAKEALEDNKHKHPDNCVTCMRKVLIMKQREEVPCPQQ